MLNHIKHHRLWITITVIVVIVFSFILYSVTRPNVEYIPPKYGEIIESIYGLGKVKPDNFYDVKLGIMSTVRELYVHEGDQVTKGDKLLRLEGNTIIYAPFSGSVTMIAYREQQPVFPQQTILRLEDLKNKYIEVSLEQQGALRVEKGQKVRVIFESVRGEVLTGSVESIFPRNEEFLVHVRVAGLGAQILPGMTADVAIEVGRKDKALLVPLSAISSGHIRVRRQGKQVVVPLQLGVIDGNWAEVLEGDIKPGDVAIVQKRDK